MMPEQLPAITQDLGVQKDAKDRVKGMLTFHKISYTTLTQDIEKLAYDAMMSGIETGFNYGWRIGQNRLLEQQKKDRAFQTRIAKTEYVDEKKTKELIKNNLDSTVNPIMEEMTEAVKKVYHEGLKLGFHICNTTAMPQYEQQANERYDEGFADGYSKAVEVTISLLRETDFCQYYNKGFLEYFIKQIMEGKA